MMNLLSITLLAQLAAPAQQTLPVLSFPEPGLDDSVAYQGYQTRFFRDAAGNTVQIYQRGGRLVHLWANARYDHTPVTHGNTYAGGVGLDIGRTVMAPIIESVVR